MSWSSALHAGGKQLELQLQPRLQPSVLLHPALGPEVALVPVGHKRLRLK